MWYYCGSIADRKPGAGGPLEGSIASQSPNPAVVFSQLRCALSEEADFHSRQLLPCRIGVSGGYKTKDLVPYAVGSKLFTLSLGALGKAPSKVTDALPEPEPAGAMAASEGDEEDDEEDLEAMQSRLATLRS